MGSRYEAPVHSVVVDGFWMYRLQVSNAQYAEFCHQTDRPLPPDPIPGYIASYPTYPVVNVNWFDASHYAQWAGGRLPSEAEWEKAARGGLQNARYPWGDEEPDEGEFANFKYYRGGLASLRAPFDSHGRGPLPCASFEPNHYGLFDMAGNVWDWVLDWYDPDYYDASPSQNPVLLEGGTTRVRRGGDWARSALSLRCACRSSLPPDICDYRMGFRVVLEGEAPG